MELVYGVHPVLEALRARRRVLRRVRLRGGRSSARERVRAAADAAGVPVVELAEREFARGLAKAARHQGVALEAGALPEQALEALLATLDTPAPRDGEEGAGATSRSTAADGAGHTGAGMGGAERADAAAPRAGADVAGLARAPARAPCLVALDGVEDPRNVGAIARAADGAGVAGLVLTTRRAPPLSPALSRASAGAIEHLPVARTPNLARALALLQGQGFWSLGADAGAEDALFATPDRLWRGALVVVLGAEGSGLRPGVARALDHRVRIPMAGAVGSLNVASAAALILYERLRRCGGTPMMPARSV